MGGAVSVATLEEDHKAALEVVEGMAAEMEDGSKKTKDEIADAVAAHEGNQLDKEKALALLAQIGDGENDEYEKAQLEEYIKAAKAPAAEAEAAPAEGEAEAAPAEGEAEAAPAEGEAEAAPAEGEAEAAPAEGEAAPAEAEAAPAEAEAEGEPAKTEEAEAPAEEIPADA